jgi:hypothetical protein
VIIQALRMNNQKRAFELTTARGVMDFPYAKCDPAPSAEDPIANAFIDSELGKQAVSYELASGRDGFVHVEQALEYNRDPSYMRELLLHQLTVQALHGLERTPLAKREIMRRLGTSPAQFYRLTDPANYRKSIDRMVELLIVLDCEVELVTRWRGGAPD